MDPAALGTLMIGLDAARLDNETNERQRRATRLAARRRQRATTAVVAGWLRLVADRLDRPAGQAGLATR